MTAPVFSDGTATYTPGVSERRGSSTTFLHSGLKNADAQSGTAQSVSATRQYDAFGNLTSSSGMWQGPFGYAGAFGYQEDATGLKLLGHRYYDPSTGRFLSRDPIKDGRNWYVYCEGDPVSFADPSGLVRSPSWPGGRAASSAIYLVWPIDDLGHYASLDPRMGPAPGARGSNLRDPLDVASERFLTMAGTRASCRVLPRSAGSVAGAGLTAVGGALALAQGLAAVGAKQCQIEELLKAGNDVHCPNSDDLARRAIMDPTGALQRRME